MPAATITAPGIDELALPNHPETKVWLKRRPLWGDKNLVQCSAIIAKREIAPGVQRTTPEGFADFLVTKALVMIHDWTVTDESGKKAPISAEALQALDPEDGEFISNEARRRFDGDSVAPLVTNSEPTSATESSSPTPESSESPISEN